MLPFGKISRAGKFVQHYLRAKGRGSRIRTRLATEQASREELLAGLNHLLAGAGNASLMTPALRHTLCDHCAVSGKAAAFFH